MSVDIEIADYCDDCGKGIAYAQTCIMRPNGETEDGLPVVGIVCIECSTRTQP